MKKMVLAVLAMMAVSSAASASVVETSILNCRIKLGPQDDTKFSLAVQGILVDQLVADGRFKVTVFMSESGIKRSGATSYGVRSIDITDQRDGTVYRIGGTVFTQRLKGESDNSIAMGCSQQVEN